MPPDSPPMGVVNFLGVTAIQNLANVSSSGITALQNVAVVNSSRINFPRVLLRLPGKSAGIFLLPPGSFPPSPLTVAKLATEGGEGPGGRKNMPPDSPPNGVVNSSWVAAVQNLADVSASGITTLQNVAVVNSFRITQCQLPQRLQCSETLAIPEELTAATL